ncbi:hypothetical protein ACLOJK_018715 [Asimina triloba]
MTISSISNAVNSHRISSITTPASVVLVPAAHHYGPSDRHPGGGALQIRKFDVTRWLDRQSWGDLLSLKEKIYLTLCKVVRARRHDTES